MFLQNTLFVLGVVLVPGAFNPQKRADHELGENHTELTGVHNCMHIIKANHTLQNSKMTSKFLEALGINEDALIGLDHTLQNTVR